MNDLKGIIDDCNKSDLVSDKVIKKVIEIIGQEEWQDLHDENNDVCTTMGELIITLKGIAELETLYQKALEDVVKERDENKKLKKLLADTNERNIKVEEAYKNKFDAEWRLNEKYQKLLTDYGNANRCSREYFSRWEECKEEIAELEKQIENMKCCGNCKFMFCNEQDKKDCGYNYKNWEMR